MRLDRAPRKTDQERRDTARRRAPDTRLHSRSGAPYFHALVTAALRAASRRLTLLYDEVMAPSGLRITQFNLLAELERRDAFPPTVGELAEILTIERSALGQTLKPLERDGLIVLDRDERDGRRRPVRLTPAGREAVVRARPYWTEAHRRFAGFFGEPGMAELRATLRDIAENPQVASAFDRSVAPG